MKAEVNKSNQYVIKGDIYERVTRVISATHSKEVDAWRKRVGEQEADRVSKETATWGELVHEITAWNDRGKWRKVEKMLKDNEALLPSLLVWKEWALNTIKKWILIEQVVFSKRLGIAGRIDRVGYVIGDRDPSIVDLKTGALWDTTGIQIWGAYRELYNEWKPKRMKAVMRGIAVQISRKEPGVLKVKDYTKDKYVVQWEETKRDYFNSIGR